jgi:enoyl-CoA hydratase/carnithine racemase
MITVDHQDKVAIVKLDRMVTNALDLELVTELSRILQGVKGDDGVGGLVLGSTNDKFFSIGFNLPELVELATPEFTTFYRAFNRLCLDLYAFSKPTVAALTGHAIAGGCILALCCDYRYLAEGKKLMGLNEVKLGVPVPYPADCMLRALVGPGHAREMMEVGEFYRPEQSLQMGLVDRVVPLAQVLPEATDRVRRLESFPRQAWWLIKRNRTEPVMAQILDGLEEREQRFLECWHANETRERLREAIEKF